MKNEFFITKTKNELANQIRYLRNYRNLTQKELADLCSIKLSKISWLEDGDYNDLSLSNLLEIAKALDVKLDIIFTPIEKMIEAYTSAKNQQTLAKK